MIDVYFGPNKTLKVLLNCSNIAIGGGIQVAAEMLEQFGRFENNEKTLVCVSKAVLEATRSRDIQLKNCEVFDQSPAQSSSSRNRLADIEKRFSPDCIFSVFGPAYVRFKSPHLMGVADGWVTHSSRLAYSSLSSIWKRLYMIAYCRYKASWYRQADRWIVEAEIAKSGLVKRLRLEPKNIDVVSNCCGTHYFEHQSAIAEDRIQTAPLNILSFAAGYPHKNLEIIPNVVSELLHMRPSLQFVFTLTLPQDDPIWLRIIQRIKRLGIEKYVSNLGRIPVGDGPKLYDDCAIVFMPSLLETFSAVYPEAMVIGRPIITSDLDFARSICGDAALYFNPTDASSAAAQILTLVDSSTLARNLIERGKQRILQFCSPKQRHEKVIQSLVRLCGSSASLES